MENIHITDKLRKIRPGIDLNRLIGSVLSKWYWFLISIVFFMTAGFFYLRYSTPVFSVKSLVLIEPADDKNEDVKASLYNEIFSFTSKDLIARAVDSLTLNVRYSIKGRIKQDELYVRCPVKLVFDSLGYLGAGRQEVRLKQIGEGLFELSEGSRSWHVFYDSWIERPYGHFKIIYRDGDLVDAAILKNQSEIVVEIFSRNDAVKDIQAALKVAQSDKRTSLLELSYSDRLPNRGIEFLNTLIHLYKKNELEEIYRSAEKTRDYINLQKASLIAGLQQNDSVAEKKYSTKVQGDPLLNEKKAQLEIMMQMRHQRNALQQLKDKILERVGNRFLLMESDGINYPFLTRLVQEYNGLVVQREELEKSVVPHEQKLLVLTSEIAAVRKRIADACDRVVVSLDISIHNTQQNIEEFEARIASISSAVRSISNTNKEYPLAESAFLYLLQRGLENDISQYAARGKSKTVVAPYASDSPIRPVKKNVYVMLLLSGILLPGVVVIIKIGLNNKVVNEKDIEAITTLPVIGSIAKTRDGEKRKIVVGPHIRTSIAEQFRLIRANLEFMSMAGNKKVYLITSSMSGEGKTFVSLNLGITMTLAKKRVVIMEFDLRKPKLSSYLNLENEGGISGYLSGLNGIEKVIKSSGVHENLFIANCGTIPPNPGELLTLPAVQQLMEELREMFDVIIIDTAPIGLVSDALVLSQHSDINMFVVRQSYTMKEQIRLFNTLHKEKKINNATVVFNGVQFLRRFGYSGFHDLSGQYGGGYYSEVGHKKSLMDKLFMK